MGPRAGLGEFVKSRPPHRDSIPGPSSPYRFVIPFIKASKKLYSIKYSLIWCAIRLQNLGTSKTSRKQRTACNV